MALTERLRGRGKGASPGNLTDKLALQRRLRCH